MSLWKRTQNLCLGMLQSGHGGGDDYSFRNLGIFYFFLLENFFLKELNLLSSLMDKPLWWPHFRDKTRDQFLSLTRTLNSKDLFKSLIYGLSFIL